MGVIMVRTILVSIVAVMLVTAFASAEVIEKEYDIAMGQKLIVDLETGGSIYIKGWDKEKVWIKARINGIDKDDYTFDIDASSSVIRIESDYDSKWGNNKSSIEVLIKVPNKFTLDLETMGGSVEIENVEGDINGKTMGGGLDFKGLNGEIQFTTMGGGIDIENTKGYLAIETMGGSVSVIDSEVDGKVSTMGGSIKLENVKGGLESKTMGGSVSYSDVTVSSGNDENDVVQISTMGGSIDVDEAGAGADVETKGGSIEIGSANKFVKAMTYGGSIEIDAIDGWVNAKTMGGDIIVNMVGDPKSGRRDIELVSMAGDIDLTVPDGMSMDIDVEIAYTKKYRREYQIFSDFDIEIDETSEWKWWSGEKRKYIYGTGKTGDGDHKIIIKTTNGDVHINKGA
jgi:DUF4097 and DUF4098 domain-containing protein YvlB